DEQARVLDYVKEAAEFIRTEEGLVSASSMCERFLFDGTMQYTPIAKLSGGEKRRLYLLRVLMEAPNVLILDEPTNDLDIQTLQILEDYLDHFAGIVIVVSHDRYFLDRVVTRIFSFEEDGSLVQSEGAYEEYRERKLLAAAEQEYAVHAGAGQAASCAVPQRTGEKQETAVTQSGREHRPKRRLSYKEQREYEGLEAEIDSLTERSELLSAAITEAATDFLKLQALTEEREAVEQSLEEKIERYIFLQEKLEAMQSS
ncbi:MAG: ATP-binding cassette domain-containing protein, partial [Lachnospiraceae bacterium]